MLTADAGNIDLPRPPYLLPAQGRCVVVYRQEGCGLGRRSPVRVHFSQTAGRHGVFDVEWIMQLYYHISSEHRQ
jgi:hypothetical protein